MSYPINLSVTGKPSPRVQHPASGGRQRSTPLNINKTRNQKSNIFSSNDVSAVKQRPKSGNVESNQKKYEVCITV